LNDRKNIFLKNFGGKAEIYTFAAVKTVVSVRSNIIAQMVKLVDTPA
jgi:hypothetical protein